MDTMTAIATQAAGECRHAIPSARTVFGSGLRVQDSQHLKNWAQQWFSQQKTTLRDFRDMPGP